MSHRQVVLATVTRLTEERDRAVTLEEVRAAIPAPDMPPHLDAVCGSLLRTGHVEAFPARAWERERRNAYRPAGTDYPVVEAMTPPSRPEIVMRAIRHLWGAEDRDGLPITSAEIRRFLRVMDQTQPLVTGKTLLPTTLNELRRPGPDGVPMVEAVRIDGLRAQRWIPYGAEWSWRVEGLKSATQADRLAMAVGDALEGTGQVLVTAAEVAPHWAGMGAGDSSTPLPGLLAEVSRPVTSASGRRVARRRPAVVRVGEVRGEALYTTPAHMKRWRGCLAPAVADLRWRQWLEGWDERWLDRELELVRRAKPTAPFYEMRRTLLLRQVALFGVVADRLDRRSTKAALDNPHRREALDRLDEAARVLGDLVLPRVPRSWLRGSRWLTAEEATAWAVKEFNLGDDPPHIGRGFLRGEVMRRRVRAAGDERDGPGAPVRWLYDPVTLRIACTERWGTPRDVVAIRHVAALLGPISSRVDQPLCGAKYGDRRFPLAVCGQWPDSLD